MKRLKRTIKLLLRWLKDLVALRHFQFAKAGKGVDSQIFIYEVGIGQEIKKGRHYENKRYNIEQAARQLDGVTIAPGQLFSFWKIIKNPDHSYKTSRVIKNEVESEEKGGGLCQVSGAVYHVSLLCGLEIVERHNHSLDLYTDETRFTPLGTDATVVYGYKDLRVRNNFGFPVQLALSTRENYLSVKIKSPQKIDARTLHFHIREEKSRRLVVVTDGGGLELGRSSYKYPGQA